MSSEPNWIPKLNVTYIIRSNVNFKDGIRMLCDGGVSSLGSCGGGGTARVVLAALYVRGLSVPSTTATPEEMLDGRGMK